MGQPLKHQVFGWFFLILLCVYPVTGRGADACLDLADTPLDSQLAASAPNLMFGLDDSGSMDWEIMTDEAYTTFGIDNRDYEYIFDDPGDNLYKTGTYAHSIKQEGRQQYWESQWFGYNVIYYNPAVTYLPWSGAIGDADIDTPRSHPYYARYYFDLSGTFWEISGHRIPNAHYYVTSELDQNVYLVAVDNGRVLYYRATVSQRQVTSVTPVSSPLQMSQLAGHILKNGRILQTGIPIIANADLLLSRPLAL